MPVSAAYVAYVLEQLAGLGRVRARPMFGAAGLYCEDLFFGIVSADTLYLRVDAAGRAECRARGLEPFRPYADRPEVSMSYFAVPAEVLEEAAALTAWGRRALNAAQLRAAARPRRRTSPRRARP